MFPQHIPASEPNKLQLYGQISPHVIPQTQQSHKDNCFLSDLFHSWPEGLPILWLTPPTALTNVDGFTFYGMTSFLHQEWEDKTWNFQYLNVQGCKGGEKRVEESRRGEETQEWGEWLMEWMRARGRWRGRVKGHVSVAGSRSESNEVRRRSCVQTEKREEREEHKTGDRETDSADPDVSGITNDFFCNLPVTTHWYQKTKMCWKELEGVMYWRRRSKKKKGGLRHSALLCTRLLAPALSVSSVDPWTCHLDSPTNHIKVSSPGIHQAKWILDPGATDRPDGEKAPRASQLFCGQAWSIHPPLLLPSTPSVHLFALLPMGCGSDEGAFWCPKRRTLVWHRKQLGCCMVKRS